MVPLQRHIADQLQANMKGRVGYFLGAKADPLSIDSHKLGDLDCSGYSRYIIYRATLGEVTVPDGSVEQHDWCDGKLRRLTHYSDVRYAKDDPTRWFICFLEPDPLGHVWFVTAGVTRECCGGYGVHSRPWDSVVLRNAQAAYEWPTVA